ncbi:MAG: GNAT family N-acetyltransferase [Hyphomicrobiaceae bacterium]
MLTHRLARPGDVPALTSLMEEAISKLLKPYLSADQIAASRTIMGIDTQLIEDGTYFVIEEEGQLAGCGGWSRRATMYGGSHSPGRNAALLDPMTEPARIRAMYTSPAFTRRGVGRLIMTLCEEAARADGFRRAELVATLAGEPLYRACGYQQIEHFNDQQGLTPVPLVKMGKTL